MTKLFKKLNFKNHSRIFSLNHPDSFEKELREMESFAMVEISSEKISDVGFAIVFVTKQDEILNYINRIAPELKGDAILWFCYPKASSKRYKCDFNRDSGWDIVGLYDLEPVRQVAIDEDWSAIRFRKVEYIKKITRKESNALTEVAKKRTTNKKFNGTQNEE